MHEEKKVISKNQRVVTADGAVLNERAQSVETNVDPKITISNLIWYLDGLITIMLALRFVLKLMGANSGNAFVSFIYSISGIFSMPFDSIFGVTKASSGNVSSVFEPSILVAMAVYALIAWGATRLLTINER